MFNDEYPPNPTNMPEDIFRAGVDVLTTLLRVEDDGKELKHIEAVLNDRGVDAALYLLYHGFCIKSTIYGPATDEISEQREFRTLLQTAASIGAYISNKKSLDIVNIEQLDKLWEVPFIDNEGEDNVQSI